MIVIILVVAVPAYSNSFVRAKIDHSLSIASSAKSLIIYACQVDPTITGLSNRRVGYRFETTEFLSNIELGGNCDSPIITVTTQATGAPIDPVITITGVQAPDSRFMNWHCASNGLETLVPDRC